MKKRRRKFPKKARRYYDKRTASKLVKARVCPTPPGKRRLTEESALILRSHAVRIAAIHPKARLVAYHQKRQRSRWDVGVEKDVMLRGLLSHWEAGGTGAHSSQAR